MKKMNLALILSAIVGTSFANCPDSTGIYVDRNNHFVAYDEFNEQWIDPNPIAGRPVLPDYYMFFFAFATPVAKSTVTADHLSCLYQAPSMYSVTLYAPSPEQQYVLSGDGWKDTGSGSKGCGTNFNSCKFSLPQ
ncbi:MAG: hypothetical protein K0R94_80 [Burkholderiales bacterium]|jgi:hypothetical protein|nr:hypothetical protein [Burkholderiales bacterium]